MLLEFKEKKLDRVKESLKSLKKQMSNNITSEMFFAIKNQKKMKNN